MKPRLLFSATLLLLTAPLLAEPAPAPAIHIQRDSARGLWGVETTNARLADIAKALSRSMGCTILVDDKASERRLDTVIIPRAAERLIPLLGRRANVSATLVYRFEMPAVEEARTYSPSGFGKDLVAQDLRDRLDIEEAARALRLPIELGPGVTGKVRLNTTRTPVARILDQIAAQSGSKWTVVVRLKTRSAVDEIAAREEESQYLYSDLAQLTPAERREELQADLTHLLELPEEERGAAVSALARRLGGMADLCKQAHENRGAVVGNVSAIAGDYDLALRRLPSDNRAWAAPVFDALRELSLQLRQLQ